MSILFSNAHGQMKTKPNRLTIPGIAAVFTHRCLLYSKLLKTADCIKLINGKDGFFSLLDTQIQETDQGKEFIVFESEFYELINNPQTKDYLYAILNRLAEVDQFEENFFLWDFTLSYFNQDKDKAIKNIAVLFQDTDEYLHLKRALRLDKAIDQETIAYLEQVLFELSHENLRGKDNVYLFPYKLDVSHPSIYYFYTSAYIRLKALKANPDNINQINGLSFYLGVFYKTANYYMGKKIILMDLPWITIDTPEDEYRVIDLYMSYQGAHWGSDKTMSFKKFRGAIEKSIPALLYYSFR